MLLHRAQRQCQHGAYNKPLAYYVKRDGSENFGNATRCHTHSLEQANGRYVAEEYYEQRRNHIETSHHNHQYQNGHHVEIQQVEPVEQVGEELFDAGHEQGRVALFALFVYQVADGVQAAVYVGLVAYLNLYAGDFVLLPVVYSLHLPDVAEYGGNVQILQLRIEQAAYLEFAHFDFVANKIGGYLVSHSVAHLLCQARRNHNVRRYSA